MRTNFFLRCYWRLGGRCKVQVAWCLQIFNEECSATSWTFFCCCHKSVKETEPAMQLLKMLILLFMWAAHVPRVADHLGVLCWCPHPHQQVSFAFFLSFKRFQMNMQFQSVFAPHFWARSFGPCFWQLEFIPKAFRWALSGPGFFHHCFHASSFKKFSVPCTGKVYVVTIPPPKTWGPDPPPKG